MVLLELVLGSRSTDSNFAFLQLLLRSFLCVFISLSIELYQQGEITLADNLIHPQLFSIQSKSYLKFWLAIAKNSEVFFVHFNLSTRKHSTVCPLSSLQLFSPDWALEIGNYRANPLSCLLFTRLDMFAC